MKDVIGIFWPLTGPSSGPSSGPSQDTPPAFPPEAEALLAEISRVSGLKIKPAAPDTPHSDQPTAVFHLAYIEGAILGFEAAVAKGLEDSASSFTGFAAADFTSFLNFRKTWIASGHAVGLPRLNISRLRADPDEEIETFLKALAPKRFGRKNPKPADIKRIAAACQPLLEIVAPVKFRHHNHKVFAQLRQIRLPRETVEETFQDLLKRSPNADQLLLCQTLPSVHRLKETLMTSKEYLARFGLSDDDIRTSYQLLLNRAPIEAELEQAKNTHPHLESLRKVLLKSSEFSRQYAKLGGAAGNSVMAGMAGMAQGIGASKSSSLQPCHADRVVFLHIPKCGGTTLHNMLSQWFKAENVHAERFNGLYGYTAANLASSLVFSGHYDYYATTLIPGPKKMISFLRDPVDRLVSLYNFHRAHSPAIIERNNLQLPRWANMHNIDAYFTHPTIRAHPAINNSIVRYFSDIPQIAQPIKGAAMRNATLDEMLEQALDNLERFAFVGFMDRYDDDMDRLADTLQCDRPGTLRKHQVLDELMETNPDMRKIKKQKPSPEARAAMEELVQYDRLFYARARELFT